jgi:D-alanyl-D-alanine carboxypeptidase (penicillin-binding protein 5/6)
MKLRSFLVISTVCPFLILSSANADLLQAQTAATTAGPTTTATIPTPPPPPNNKNGLANSQMAITSHDTNSVVLSGPVPPALIPPAPQIDAKGFVVMDANSGQVLAQNNMNQKMSPASLTKLMTIYVIMQNLAAGKIKMNDGARISENAWHTGGSRMFLKLGTQVTIQDLLNGIIVASGNDACVAIAEFVAGSEDSFTGLMNQTAEHLGMKNSHFTDANGLPHPQHYSSPYDLALLARSIITHFPQYYGLFKQKWVLWNNIKQPNRNRLLWRDATVDGLKTGHTQDAGFCLVASAKRNNMRLIAVVMGAPSDTQRANSAQALLNWGFRFFESHKLFDSAKPLSTPRVWMGKNEMVPMGLARDLYVTIPYGSYAQLKAVLNINPNLKAPIYKGQTYGNVSVTLGDKTVSTTPVIALQDDPDGGVWTRFTDRIAYFFHGWFSGHND